MYTQFGKLFLAFTLLCLVGTPALADKLQVGDTVSGFELPDQYGNQHSIKEMPKTLILTFEKRTGGFVNGFLKMQDKSFLKKNNALYIADIARMPMLITNMFALPKMKRYEHTVLLAYEDDFQALYPIEKAKATVIHFDQKGAITEILFVDDEASLKAEILK
jgi:hypothetical protein